MRYSSMMLENYSRRGPRYWRVAMWTALSAAGVNAAVYLMAFNGGIFHSLRLSQSIGGELNIGPVIIASFLVPFFGFFIFFVLDRSKPKSYRMFRDVTLLAMAASLLLPLTMNAWPWPQLLVIQLMHVIVAVITLYGVNYWQASQPAAR